VLDYAGVAALTAYRTGLVAYAQSAENQGLKPTKVVTEAQEVQVLLGRSGFQPPISH
jgi:hypothetical protein